MILQTRPCLTVFKRDFLDKND
eukprot:UN11260